MWVGNSKSVTATHKDNFENIYVQIRGRKHFVLLSPLHHHCMNEKPLQPATYVRGQDGTLSLCLDEDTAPVPFATWDPDHLDSYAAPLSRFAQPVRVTLEPGDMLYLPAMWQVSIHCHHVSSRMLTSHQGITRSRNQCQKTTIMALS